MTADEARENRSRELDRALALPPSGKGGSLFALVAFFLLGAGLTALVLVNPLNLSFLPGAHEGVPPGPQEAEPETHTHAEGAQIYQCPMHPDVIQSEPGNCPKCGMNLVAVEPTEGVPAAAGKGDREILYWYAPMDPEFISDEPGKSPMGMDLVPRYAQGSPQSSSGEIRIDPVQVQNIGVVSVKARLGDVARAARTVGILDFNADLVSFVSPKFSGWIEKVHLTYVGQEVKTGDPLFDIYSPELVTTQEEYLRAMDYAQSLKGSGRPETLEQAESLLRSTRDRLKYWDIADDQIERLEREGEAQRALTVRSPVDGVVVEVTEKALEGMYVQPGMNLYKIADLSTVWIHVDVYESDISWIRAGQRADVTFHYEGDWTYRGRTLFLYPELSKETRTLKICVEVPNEDRRLRPGMYADVTVYGPPVSGAVLVPDSAVIRSGERTLVFVDLGKGRFQPRTVSVGIRTPEGEVQVTGGVLPGEAVVTQAQFMIDSESRWQEAIAKYMDRRSGQ